MVKDRLPRGRPSWVSGSKLVFLLQFSAEYHAARDAGLVAAGLFYTGVTKKFISKYGWGFDRWTDKECPDPDQDAWLDVNDYANLEPGEAAQRRDYYRGLREVSDIFVTT